MFLENVILSGPVERPRGCHVPLTGLLNSWPGLGVMCYC